MSLALAWKLSVSLGVVYGAVVLGAWAGQRKLMYFPDAARTPPAATGLTGVEERTFPTPDGERIVAWHARPRPGAPTLLYLHGNAGSLAMRAERIRRFQDEGWGVLMMSWRGYSGSSGRPSEAANVADAVAAYYLLRGEGVAAGAIVLYGESLGSGVAVQVAARHPVGGIILDAPFTSTVDVAAAVYPFLPVRALMSDRYESIRHIGAVRAPLLVIHGERDAVVPVTMGRRLYEAAPGRKRLVTFPEGGHIDLYMHGAIVPVREFVSGLGRAATAGE